jgi:hypothetical protein
MVKISDQADNYEHCGPQGQRGRNRVEIDQVTPNAMEKCSLPAEALLNNRSGLVLDDSHAQNGEWTSETMANLRPRIKPR